MSYNQCSPYAQCSRDDVADCAICGDPLAGDNDTGICYKCSRSVPAAVTATGDRGSGRGDGDAEERGARCGTEVR